ncbi:MAG: hypothetical protein HQL23_08390 [Candidatus Omnitrophica bacterium]|nr:hypothetical protein [Candidatus Omnitrophota bacterium]
MKRKAQAATEYIFLIVFIFAAFLFFQKYIVRAVNGRWKSVGDQIGGGQIYDPVKTHECAVGDEPACPDKWYNVKYYQQNNCDAVCVGADHDAAACCACLDKSFDKYCVKL